ncbi:MAG TPA: 50S ribosome-binding GTPase [Hydrogenophilus thermoluteolus]|nr:50S ribosome-binding GTPase [Hydrogenophilus thermoluteolus]HNU19366.1 50S ribosome-binding GTPase [Hydrogenophilus thermoluteolus]
MYSLSDTVDVIETVRPVVRKYLDGQTFAAGSQAIERVLTQQRPRVLIYGAYNSGKSTLVNALLGKALAATGDKPVTDRVTAYPWNRVVLLDTPGINAPIVHEQITEAALREVLLVLFVIRQGDQDVAPIYDRLFQLLQAGKKLFVVLNHETASDEELRKIYDRTNELLNRFAAQHNVSDETLSSVQIYPVNLEAAWKGRSKNAEALLRHSGFFAFEAAFRAWLDQYDTDVSRVAQVAQTVVATWLEPALAHHADGRTDESVAEYQTQRQALLAEKARIASEWEHFLNTCTASEARKLRSLLESNIRKNGADPDEVIVRWSEACTEKAARWLEKRLGEAPALNVTIDRNTRVPLLNIPEISPLYEKMRPVFKKLATDPKVIKEGLKILGRTNPWTKRIPEKTLNTWASRISWLLNVAITSWEAYEQAQQEREANERARALKIELARIAQEIGDDMRQGLYQNGLEVIESCYAPKLDEIDTALAYHAAQDDERQQDRVVLEHARGRLKAAFTEINFSDFIE